LVTVNYPTPVPKQIEANYDIATARLACKPTNNLLAAILAGISLAAFPARLHGANLECPAFALPKIEIRIGPPLDQIDTTKSLEQVRAAANGRDPSAVVGAYLGALQFGIQIDDSVRKSESEHSVRPLNMRNSSSRSA
jgi:hypothetical protein